MVTVSDQCSMFLICIPLPVRSLFQVLTVKHRFVELVAVDLSHRGSVEASPSSLCCAAIFKLTDSFRTRDMNMVPYLDVIKWCLANGCNPNEEGWIYWISPSSSIPSEKGTWWEYFLSWVFASSFYPEICRLDEVTTAILSVAFYFLEHGANPHASICKIVMCGDNYWCSGSLSAFYILENYCSTNRVSSHRIIDYLRAAGAVGRIRVDWFYQETSSRNSRIWKNIDQETQAVLKPYVTKLMLEAILCEFRRTYCFEFEGDARLKGRFLAEFEAIRRRRDGKKMRKKTRMYLQRTRSSSTVNRLTPDVTAKMRRKSFSGFVQPPRWLPPGYDEICESEDEDKANKIWTLPKDDEDLTNISL